jgi:hypothetical protein
MGWRASQRVVGLGELKIQSREWQQGEISFAVQIERWGEGIATDVGLWIYRGKTPTNGGEGLGSHFPGCSHVRRNFDVSDIGGVQDDLQLLSSRQMPSKASRIIVVPPPEPRLQYGERSAQSTHSQGQPNRRFIAISSHAALAHTGQNQVLDSGP